MSDDQADREAEELLPCPFCGGAASFEAVQAGAYDGVRKTVGCGTEECQGFQSVITFETKRAARAAWNTRIVNTELAALRAKVEELATEINILNARIVTLTANCSHELDAVAAAQQENRAQSKLLKSSKKYLEQCRCAGSDGWKQICEITDAIDARIAAEKEGK